MVGHSPIWMGMKKSVVLLLHLGFWLCYFLLIAIMLGVYYRSNGQAIDHTYRIINAFKNLFFFAVVPSVLSFYLSYLLLFPRYLQGKKYLLSLLNGLLLAAGSALFGYFLLRICIESGWMDDMDRKRGPQINVVLAMTGIALVSGAVALVLKGCITWFEELKWKEELQRKNHETEMALVKAQLDPHFLFNTLNNIDVLILKDPTEASNYLIQLSDILRFMLYETKTDRILLEKELEYIKKYIALQKIRSANASYVHFQVTGNTTGKTIAPLVFIPFIENAFKHTSNKKLEHAIRVELLIHSESMEFICENKLDSQRRHPKGASGLGNELIRKRLQMLYPEKHTLEIHDSNESYCVHLTIAHG